MVKKSLWLMMCLILAVACSQAETEPTPTVAPPPTTTAVVTVGPEDAAGDGDMATATEPATPALTAVASPTDLPRTATPAPAPTSAATATPAATPGPLLSIDRPAAGERLMPGAFTFVGRLSPMPAEPPLLQLLVGGGEVFSGPTVLDPAAGEWAVTVTLPAAVNGPAEARLNHGDRQQTVTFILAPDATADAPRLTLSRPVSGTQVVAGYTMFMAGEASSLLDDTLTIAVYARQCTQLVSTINFGLSGGSWYGQLILDRGASPGPACAVAYTGTRGEGDWREARAPLTIVAPDDPAATMVGIGNPPGFALHQGKVAELYGVAVNAPGNQVSVTVLSEPVGDGPTLTLASGTALVDRFGYWSATLPLAADYVGPARVRVAMGDAAALPAAEAETSVVP